MNIVKAQQFGLFFLLLGLIILPFIYWPFASIPFELPRVMYVLRLIEIFTVMGIFVFWFNPKTKFKLYFSSCCLIAFGISAFISSVLGTDIVKSTVGNMYRGDGLITLFHFIGLIILIPMVWKHTFRRFLTVGIILGSLGVSIGTVVSYFCSLNNISFFPPWQGSYGFTFGQALFLAGFLVITLPFYYFLYFTEKASRKYWWLLCFLIQCSALVLTHSAGAILTAFCVGSLICYIKSSVNKQKKIIIFSVVLACIIVSGVYIWIKKNELPSSINAESRTRIFTKLILASEKKPLLGWGWSNVDHAFESIDWPYKFTIDVYVDKAHSTLLEILVTTGIVGLLLYMLFISSIVHSLFKESFRKGKDNLWFQTLLLIILAFCIHSQTNVVGIAEECIFWVICGISITTEHDLSRRA